MFKLMLLIVLFLLSIQFGALAEQAFETDIVKTSEGDLKITFLGHGTLMLTFGGNVIHIDPFSRVADYSKLPQADMILLTHEHPDHLDLKALEFLRTEKTVPADKSPKFRAKATDTTGYPAWTPARASPPVGSRRTPSGCVTAPAGR